MLTAARLEICSQMRFLAPALARLEPVLTEKYMPSAVDGMHFFCHHDHEQNAAHLLFHGLCHCLLGHLFLRDASALACDLAAALVTSEVAPYLFLYSGNLLFVEVRRRCMGQLDPGKLDALLSEDSFLKEKRG